MVRTRKIYKLDEDQSGIYENIDAIECAIYSKTFIHSKTKNEYIMKRLKCKFKWDKATLEHPEELEIPAIITMHINGLSTLKKGSLLDKVDWDRNRFYLFGYPKMRQCSVVSISEVFKDSGIFHKEGEPDVNEYYEGYRVTCE